MSEPKKVFTDSVSVVDGDFLTTIYGGDNSAQIGDPRLAGHIHSLDPGDIGSEFGFAPKIDLTSNIAGRLTLPTPELKSIKLSATQAVPLTSSLFWTLPIPSDAYNGAPSPMYLNIYWSANGTNSPGNVAFRVDWMYLQAGQNVMPPSVISRGSTAWPANTIGSNNPTPTTLRFQSTATAASRLYVNDTLTGANTIALTLPANLPSSVLTDFLLMGLEISSCPTTTLSNPMEIVNVFAVDILYPSQTLGNNTTPTILSNNSGLFDF